MLNEVFARIALVIVKRGIPGVLIVGLNVNSGGSEDGAHAPADDDFSIGEVGEDFGGGPFVGCGPLAKFCRVDAFYQALEALGRGGLNLDRILSLRVREDALRVSLGGFAHWNLLGPNLRIVVCTFDLTRAPCDCVHEIQLLPFGSPRAGSGRILADFASGCWRFPALKRRAIVGQRACSRLRTGSICWAALLFAVRGLTASQNGFDSELGNLAKSLL